LYNGDSEDEDCGISVNKVYGIYFDIAGNIGWLSDSSRVHAFRVLFRTYGTVKAGSYLLGFSPKRFGDAYAYRITRLRTVLYSKIPLW
jgi:hypothetical protein